MTTERAPFHGDDARAQLHLTQRHIVRLPLVTVLADLVIVWLLVRQDLAMVAGLWLGAQLLVQVLRWRLVGTQAPDEGGQAAGAGRRLAWSTGVRGLLRAVPVLLLFTRDAQAEQFVLTVIHVGGAAGAIAVIGGRWRIYLAWAVPALGSVIVGWLWQGTALGIVLALLIAQLMALLTAHVADFGRTLAQLAQLARDNAQLAASLRTQRDRVAEASQAKTRFFHAAGHDLRQPLHALQTNAAALQVLGEQLGDTRLRDIAAVMTRCVDHGQTLIDDLLDISRLDAGVLRPDLQPVDIGQLAADVHAEFAALARARGLTLTHMVDGPGPLCVRSDESMLRRILHNLVGNAIKYTPQGSVTLKAAAVDGGGASLEVVDTGCGIAPHEHERVFGEFQRGSATATDGQPGLGLGLAIVRRMAGLLEAELKLDSTPGRGTRVTLRLPPAAA